ncbi:MAG: hypothetical protein PHC99_07765 [Methylococcales bacterium]|nr:hypothetical protein [Methylococcales bacterium]
MNSLALSALENRTMSGLNLSPRLINRKLNIIRHAASVVEKQKGHATNKAVAEYLGVSIDEFNHILQDANTYRLFQSAQEAA